MNSTTSISCPNCSEKIDVNHLLKQQIEASFQKQFEEKSKELQSFLNQKSSEIEKEKAALELYKKQEKEIFERKLEQATAACKRELEAAIKQKIQLEQEEKWNDLQKELKEKSDQVREFAKLEAQVTKLEREKLEMRDVVEAESQKMMNQQIAIEKERIHKLEREKSELREKELLKQIEDQKRLTEEMKRKQEQGSMQLQGEVQELAIEEYLTQQFPLDVIEEIKKGATGADCIQVVHTRDFPNCGSIYYESKRTKSFQPAWIEKFKNDIRNKKADIGVLVTEVLPSGMQRMGFKDGIWICTFEEFKGLVLVLRQSLIQLHRAVKNQENKGDKMTMLYDFLTGNEFRMQVEGIVEGFTQMKADLDKEKNVMKKVWSQREKQIEKVIDNTIGMYGSIKGIAGHAVQTVKALENDDSTLSLDLQ